jgi:hypothetical protein
MMLAPGASSGAAAFRLPSVETFPPLGEHLVEPEVTRDEVIRGRKVVAMPARAPHGDRHFELDFVLRGNVAKGYVGSTDLITRVSGGSDFASDTCIRKAGEDPRTNERWLEEVAFEIVNQQSMRDIREKAEDLVARGVRRVFAIFVKKGEVSEWSSKTNAFTPLARDATIEDRTLLSPIRVEALLNAAAADNAVASALVEKKNPVIEALGAERERKGELRGKTQGKIQGKAAAILAVLAARAIDVSDEMQARVLACQDDATLDTWLARAAVASSLGDVLER